MVFFFYVACDIYGEKHNVRMEFAQRPTFGDVLNAAQSQFDVVARANRPAHCPDIPFRPETPQIFDDAHGEWVDFVDENQLTRGCQVYVFQPETQFTVDHPQMVPDALDGAVTYQSEHGALANRVATDRGAPPTHEEKIMGVWRELDPSGKGYATYANWRKSITDSDIKFAYATFPEVFDDCDRDNNGQVTYDEWVRYADENPEVLDALFFRRRAVLPDHGCSPHPAPAPMRQPLAAQPAPVQVIQQPVHLVQNPAVHVVQAAPAPAVVTTTGPSTYQVTATTVDHGGSNINRLASALPPSASGTELVQPGSVTTFGKATSTTVTEGPFVTVTRRPCSVSREAFSVSRERF